MEKIGLLDVDSKIPNLALMKLSSWYKSQGYVTEFYMDLMRSTYSKVYVSKVFNFTAPPDFLPHNAILGGTGYDPKSSLYEEIPNYENIYPDYSLYRCEHAIGFISRGCIRHCEFCLVPIKEGKLRKASDLSSFWRGQEMIMLLDNSLTALPDCVDILTELSKLKSNTKKKVRIDISQGMDLRIMRSDVAVALSKVCHYKRIHFAWDNIKEEKRILEGLQCVLDGGVPADKIMIYVLVGFNSTPEEDMYRLMKLKEYKVHPYVMAYNRKDKYQTVLANWVNSRFTFASIPWDDFKRGRLK